MAKKPSFAVIGAGVSGSFCAWTLLRSQQASTVKVFEMGRGAGGRCSSRRTRDITGFYVDHGCPAFTASDAVPGWAETVGSLESAGVIEKWNCTTGVIDTTAESKA